MWITSTTEIDEKLPLKFRDDIHYHQVSLTAF